MGAEERKAQRTAFSGLLKAFEAWGGEGDADLLVDWLAKELDVDGAPVRLAIAEWSPALDLLARAREARPDLPESIDERLLAFFRMLLRFSKPDGRPATLTAAPEPADAVRERLALLGDAFPESDAARVLGWWYPSREVEPIPPPLPAWSNPDRVLGVLRADWTSRGDLVVFDHRKAGGPTRLEVFGAGQSWLGDTWRAPGTGDVKTSVGKPLTWTTSSNADVAEWTFRAGALRVTRTAVMLRGRKIAILADMVEGIKPPTSLETRWELPPGRVAEPIADSRALLLRTGAAGASAQAIPLALPSLPYQTDRGRFGFEPDTRELVLSQAATGARAWLPLLLSWDHARHRKRLQWRVLTVSENSQVCPPETAWAARVSWGRTETFVVYRSLGPTARRSFLGCSTSARLFVGRFTPEGDVEPIVAIKES
ncbi:MAG: hypothetical protein P4L85_20260 [Paludisphaera borealis]|uniref:hypothetical protein n=1 Tax=Paludisphaera borealis TaxID=1387353 RepID=UPI002849623B|nr:hypothetical protein [Paludisphaera borealis]MDR3621697.1 hypothetical protein [Paludisphaera borealis]